MQYEISLLGQKGSIDWSIERSEVTTQSKIHFHADLGRGISIMPKLKGKVEYLTESRFPSVDLRELGAADMSTFYYADGVPGSQKTWKFEDNVLTRSDGVETKMSQPFVDPVYLLSNLHRLPKGFHDFEVLIGRRFHTLTVVMKEDGTGRIETEDRKVSFVTDENGIQSLESKIFPMVSLKIARVSL